MSTMHSINCDCIDCICKTSKEIYNETLEKLDRLLFSTIPNNTTNNNGYLTKARKKLDNCQCDTKEKHIIHQQIYCNSKNFNNENLKNTNKILQCETDYKQEFLGKTQAVPSLQFILRLNPQELSKTCICKNCKCNFCTCKPETLDPFLKKPLSEKTAVNKKSLPSEIAIQKLTKTTEANNRLQENNASNKMDQKRKRVNQSKCKQTNIACKNISEKTSVYTAKKNPVVHKKCKSARSELKPSYNYTGKNKEYALTKQLSELSSTSERVRQQKIPVKTQQTYIACKKQKPFTQVESESSCKPSVIRELQDVRLKYTVNNVSSNTSLRSIDLIDTRKIKKLLDMCSRTDDLNTLYYKRYKHLFI